MRILVCGGREFDDYTLLEETLEGLINEVWHQNEDESIVVIQGGAKGADFLARAWAKTWENFLVSPKMTQEEYPADWKTHGKAAGAIRNQQMLDEGNPDIVVAFPGGNGTADMVRRARKAGIEVIEVDND